MQFVGSNLGFYKWWHYWFIGVFCFHYEVLTR